MTLTIGTGPFGDQGEKTFNFEVRAPRDHVLFFEDSPRRVRVMFGGETVADSRRVKLMHEKGLLPVYYFPEEDVRMDLLEESNDTTYCPFKGDASYWSVQVGDTVAENAVWHYPEPIDSAPPLAGYLAFYWRMMDAWFEEDEEVFVHPRDPYHRVDVLAGSRHVRAAVAGQTVAETRRPWLLFETGLPTRYYLPRADVRMDRLAPTGSQPDPVSLQGHGPLLVGQGRGGGRGGHRLELPVPDPRVPQDRQPGLLLQRARRHLGRRRAPAQAGHTLVAAAGT